MTMTTKDWHNFLLHSLLYEPDTEELIPCRVEIRNPLNDWSRSWSLSRLNGLSSDSTSFLWKLLHQLLPVKERLERILPTVTSPICQVCELGVPDSLPHALAYCSASSPVFNWMMAGLGNFTRELTVEKVLVLDFTLTEPLSHQELPLVWFTAEVLKRIWKCRQDGKPCRLGEIRANLEAQTNLILRSKYGDMVPVLRQMF